MNSNILKKNRSIISAVAGLCNILYMAAHDAQGQVPQLISYQGRVSVSDTNRSGPHCLDHETQELS